MRREHDVRATVILGLRAGRTTKEISGFDNIPLRTVYNVKARHDTEIEAGKSPEEISFARKPHRRRNDAKDNDFEKKVQEIIDEDPGRSMCSIARELQVSDSTI
jgi:hypothetical protein